MQVSQKLLFVHTHLYGSFIKYLFVLSNANYHFADVWEDHIICLEPLWREKHIHQVKWNSLRSSVSVFHDFFLIIYIWETHQHM